MNNFYLWFDEYKCLQETSYSIVVRQARFELARGVLLITGTPPAPKAGASSSSATTGHSGLAGEMFGKNLAPAFSIPAVYPFILVQLWIFRHLPLQPTPEPCH
jgi:hypothetical protein